MVDGLIQLHKPTGDTYQGAAKETDEHFIRLRARPRFEAAAIGPG